jgi:hypothetical protein
MKRIEFRLSMPGRGSWNGGWSGAEKNYAIVKSMTEKTCKRLNIVDESVSWSYRWNDGWGACVTARIVSKGERLKKSDGFCGYDWMVRSIIAHGDIYNEQ